MGDSDHRRDEDESRGVRDRSRSPERGGGGDGGYGDGRPAYDGGGGGGGYDDRGGGGGGDGGGGNGKGTGVALRWNEKGFGFIKPDDGGGDLFCHYSSILDGNMLREGAQVQFVKVYDERKGKERAGQVSGAGVARKGRGGRRLEAT